MARKTWSVFEQPAAPSQGLALRVGVLRFTHYALASAEGRLMQIPFNPKTNFALALAFPASRWRWLPGYELIWHRLRWNIASFFSATQCGDCEDKTSDTTTDEPSHRFSLDSFQKTVSS
jgi:hypothetical protein